MLHTCLPTFSRKSRPVFRHTARNLRYQSHHLCLRFASFVLSTYVVCMCNVYNILFTFPHISLTFAGSRWSDQTGLSLINDCTIMADVLQSICNPLPLSSSQSSIVKEGWLFKRGQCCAHLYYSYTQQLPGGVLCSILLYFCFHTTLTNPYCFQANTSKTGGPGILYCLLTVHSWAIETSPKVQWMNLLTISLLRDVKLWVSIVLNLTHSLSEDYNGPLLLNERFMCLLKKKGTTKFYQHWQLL